jgi:phosphatidylglycerol---prolipoprotein diacylglyceryl transferase
MINTAEIIPESFKVLGVVFNLYGLIIAVAVMLLYIFGRSRLEGKGYSERNLDLLFFLTIILGIIGGRIFYALLNWNLFAELESPLLEAGKVWNGGLHLFGVFAGVLIAVLIAAKIIKKNFFEIADSIVLYVPLAQALGRLGNLVNLELFGPPTNLPWGFFLPIDKRPDKYLEEESFHPLFLYEALLNVLSFFVLKYFSKKSLSAGILTAVYFFNYAVIRFFLEFLRIDTEPVWLGLKLIQLVCILIAAICMVSFLKEALKVEEKRANAF